MEEGNYGALKVIIMEINLLSVPGKVYGSLDEETDGSN